MINGEPLPAPEPQASHGPNTGWDAISSFLPFAIFGSLFAGGVLRAVLGSLLGSAAAGSLVAVVTWFVIQSLIASAALGGLAFLIVLIASAFQTAGPRRSYGGSPGCGGGWSSGSSSSDSDSSFSGGGGSFGGGGASGSW